MTNLAKIRFTGELVLESGLHIGASSAFAAIGAIDNPVIKDPLTHLPIIPGSSLKGKMRSLLAAALNEKTANNPNQDCDRIIRLFGASVGGGQDGKAPVQGRFLFRDSVLTNGKELTDMGINTYTEVKFENTIDRVKMTANPRQIERAVRGSKFNFELIYNVMDSAQVEEDLETILTGFKLLELDYLGGSGSRGYGKVKFANMHADTVFGNYDVSEINSKLEA